MVRLSLFGAGWVNISKKIFNSYRGVNVFGGDAAAPAAGTSTSTFSNQNIGTYGTDWLYDSLGSFQFYHGRGHRLIRVPFRLERLFSSLNDDGTVTVRVEERDRLLSLLDNAATVGLDVMLEPHNYGAFWKFDGSQGVRRDVLSNEFTSTHWRNISRAMVDIFWNKRALLGWDLMNEPAMISDVLGTFTSSRNIATFDIDVESWTGGGSPGTTAVSHVTTPVQAGAGALAVTSSGMTAGSSASVQAYQPWAAASDQTAHGLDFIAWVRAPENGWTGQIQVETLSGWVTGLSETLSANTWAQVKVTLTTAQAQGFHRVMVQFHSNSAPATGATFHVDTVQQGTVSGAKTAEKVWEEASQIAYDAVRGRETELGLARKWIAVPTYQWSGAWRLYSTYSDTPGKHAAGPWITEVAGENRLIYTVHDYWQVQDTQHVTYNECITLCGGGTAAGRTGTPEGRTYTAGTNADAFITRQREIAANFKTWLNGKKGWIGEYGIYGPRADRPDAEVAQWVNLADKVLTDYDTHGFWASAWAVGEWWPNTGQEFENFYINNPEPGPVNTINWPTVAATIEAHPSS